MKPLSLFLMLICLTGGQTVWGWNFEDHIILTRASVRSVPEEVPEFFRNGEGMIAHMVLDPDVSKRSLPLLRGAEYPEHYLNRESLKGHELPESRYDFIKLCYELGVKPDRLGTLPYALGEWTEHLAIAFAEYRRWPDNRNIKIKCLMYAGYIAHFAEDLCQPLHLTIHHHGRVDQDGTVHQKDIHEKVDGLLSYLKIEPDDLASTQKVAPFEVLIKGILAEFEATFALVDKVYEIGPSLPALGETGWKQVPEAMDFAQDRGRAAVRFTASLYLTAWKLSEGVEFREENDRAKLENFGAR